MSDETSLTPHAAHNRRMWDDYAAEYQSNHGRQLADSGGAAWGVWQIPESELHVLGDVAGRDVLELGCGAAQWSIALASQGARVTGIDNSAKQLQYARELMAGAGVDFPLIHGSADATGLPAPRSTSSSATTARCRSPIRISPSRRRRGCCGAADCSRSRCTPRSSTSRGHTVPTIPASACCTTTGTCTCARTPASRSASTCRTGRGSASSASLTVADLIELRPSADATSSYRDDSDREWARRWPMEHIWRVVRA